MKTKQKRTFVEFCKGLVKKVPSIAADVADVIISPNPVGAAVGKIGNLLRSQAEKDEQAKLALLEFEKYEKEWEKEMYALEIEAYKTEVDDRRSARDKYINADRSSADEIGRKIINRNLTYIFILVMVQLVVSVATVFLSNYIIEDKSIAVTLGTSLGSVVGTAVGTVIGSLLQERNQVVSFHFGSSMGSRIKDINNRMP